MASSSNSPCAACKFLRRKCTLECVFAPYFPPDQPQKFANVHKIFGASNVTKLLNELHPHQREDAVNSLAYEADARVKDPVYGCVGAISILQHQVKQLQTELHHARSELSKYINAGIAIPPMGMGMGLAGSSRDQIFRDQNIMESHIPRDHILRATNYDQTDIVRLSGPGYDPNYLAISGSLAQAQAQVQAQVFNPYPRTGSSSDERTCISPPYLHPEKREE